MKREYTVSVISNNKSDKENGEKKIDEPSCDGDGNFSLQRFSSLVSDLLNKLFYV